MLASRCAQTISTLLRCRRRKAETQQKWPRSEELDEECTHYSDHRTELEEQAAELQGAADSILVQNQNVLHEFKARQAKINDALRDVGAGGGQHWALAVLSYKACQTHAAGQVQ
jgi:DNA repair exonuclease SbcCD ATPase subunit